MQDKRVENQLTAVAAAQDRLLAALINDIQVKPKPLPVYGIKALVSSQSLVDLAEVFYERINQSVTAVVGPGMGGAQLIGPLLYRASLGDHDLRGGLVTSKQGGTLQDKAVSSRTQFKGQLLPGDRVAIVDDVVFSGTSILRTIDALEAHGVQVIQVVVAIDLSNGKFDEKLAAHKSRALQAESPQLESIWRGHEIQRASRVAVNERLELDGPL